MKIGDDKSKAPASLFISLGPGYLEPFFLDSTFAASESHPFSAGSYGASYRRQRERGN